MRISKTTIIGLIIALLLVALMPLGCVIEKSKIAVLSLNGPIQAGGASLLFGGSVITPQTVKGQLERAKEDSSVKAVVISVESPGGQVAACQEIVSYIEQVGKPIVISMGTMAASGGYFISAKADKIVALPGTLTGSIGVISQIPNIKGLYEKLGIEMKVFKGGKYKDMYGGQRELTPEEQKIMQQMVDRFYNQFVQLVAEGRGLDEMKVRALATGQLYIGEQAKELGLVDELGGIETAIDLAASLAGVTSPEVEYYYPESPSLLNILLGMSWGKLQSLVQMRSLDADDLILLEILSNRYAGPEYR